MPPARTLALAATKRVVDRVHRYPTYRGPTPLPPIAASLAELDVCLLGIPDFADGGAASEVDEPDFARRHTQVGIGTLLGQQLDASTRRTCYLRAAAGPQFDGVHHS